MGGGLDAMLPCHDSMIDEAFPFPVMMIKYSMDSCCGQVLRKMKMNDSQSRGCGVSDGVGEPGEVWARCGGWVGWCVL